LQELCNRCHQGLSQIVTEPIKLLLTGNATCANRGDSAIFRGLINEIESQCPGAQLTCCSRHPVASSVVLQRPLEPDWIYQSQLVSGSNVKKAKALLGKKWAHSKMLWMQKSKLLANLMRTPASAAEFNERIKDFDAVLHVGGSFFVDLYGVRQFDVMMACALSNKPVYLVGHSMGPFQISTVGKYARAFLPTVEKLFLRESVSRQMLVDANVDVSNVAEGSDTAWLMPESVDSSVFDAELRGCVKPMVAVTVRKLAPFDKRLGITQQQYEENVASLLDSIIDKGFHIVGVSMCTGLGGYAHDDRLVADSVRQQLKNPSGMTVLWHEYNDLEVGGILKRCQLLLGTRLHSAILSLRYGTPTLALYYEHKSEGVLNQLGLSEWSVRLQDVAEPSTRELAVSILDNQTSARERVQKAVSDERTRASKMVASILRDIESRRSS